VANIFRVTVWTLALASALMPLPASLVEQVYSRGIYPAFQPYVTAASNMVPVALLDVALGILLLVFAVRYVRAIRAKGWRLGSASLALSLLTTTAVVYLLFLATWGLNYRRIPLEGKLDFDPKRISRDGAVRLASLAVERLNAGHAAAHALPFRPDVLQHTFVDTQLTLGARSAAGLGRPKRSLVGLYFRRAAIDGMTVPIVLEIILNPDLLPVEQPSVLAHEWAHLAGYADESEANFVAWITGVRSEDLVAQYSAWLDAYRLAVNALPRAVRPTLPPLDPGPRADLIAIAERYQRSSPAVRRAARSVYDSYLKANRVEEGIANYEVALQLMLGTSFDANWKPRLR
jgi:hypothetical protein